MIIHKIQYLRHPFISSKPPKPFYAPIFHNCSLFPSCVPSCSLSFPFSFSCSSSFLSFDFSHIFLIPRFLFFFFRWGWLNVTIHCHVERPTGVETSFYISVLKIPPLTSFGRNDKIRLFSQPLEAEPSVIKSGKTLTDGPCFRRFWTFWGTVSHFFGLFCDWRSQKSSCKVTSQENFYSFDIRNRHFARDEEIDRWERKWKR